MHMDRDQESYVHSRRAVESTTMSNENPHPLSRRMMLTAGTAALATGGATLPAIAGPPDPVFALIEAERRAMDAFITAIELQDAATTRAEEDAAEALWELRNAAQHEAQAAVFAAKATTAAGLLAAMDLHAARAKDWLPDPFDRDLDGLFESIRAFLAGRA